MTVLYQTAQTAGLSARSKLATRLENWLSIVVNVAASVILAIEVVLLLSAWCRATGLVSH